MKVLADNVIERADSYRNQFETAKPFRHVLITPFFDPPTAEAMLAEFPVPPHKIGKFACHDVRSISPTYRLIDDHISSPEFAALMERITGIENLLYDPEYHGAGTHDNFSGQGMDAHVDFNLHATTGYHRRFNTITYLNKEWKDEWGGNIELHTNPWDFEKDEVVSFPPLFNHCILFETNEYSWHGFQKLHPPDDRGISRKSFTIYMYTKDRPANEIVPKHRTIYVQSGPPKHLRAGYALTAEDLDELKERFHWRNTYLQGMYERESEMLIQAETRKNHIVALKKQVENLSKHVENLRKSAKPAKTEPAKTEAPPVVK